MSATIAHKRRGGFTLIELLIVTVILGVLFMLAAPKVAEMREGAFVAATKVEIHSAEQAIQLYRVIHDVYPRELADLGAIGFTKSGDIRYCEFRFVAAGGDGRGRGEPPGWGRGRGRGRGGGRGRGRDNGRGPGGTDQVAEGHVVIAAMHEGARTLVTTHYPTWSGRMEESPADEESCRQNENGGGAVDQDDGEHPGRERGRGPGRGRGRGRS